MTFLLGGGGVDSQHLSITGIISFINQFILKFWVLCISCVRNCADKGRAEFPLRWYFQVFFLMFPKVSKLLDRHAENFFFVFLTRRFLIFKLLWVRNDANTAKKNQMFTRKHSKYLHLEDKDDYISNSSKKGEFHWLNGQVAPLLTCVGMPSGVFPTQHTHIHPIF